MTRPDPFASAPAPVADEAQTAPAEAPASVWDNPPTSADVKQLQNVVQNDGKIVLTFKGGTGFDAPWIVVHATTLTDALDTVSDEGLADLMGRVQRAGAHFAGQGPVNAGRGGQQTQRSNAPAAAQQPPPGSPPCPGPGWVYKSGKKKNGQGTWQGWMPPQGSTEKPVFFD